jgi:hypothetical protein
LDVVVCIVIFLYFSMIRGNPWFVWNSFWLHLTLVLFVYRSSLGYIFLYLGVFNNSFFQRGRRWNIFFRFIKKRPTHSFCTYLLCARTAAYQFQHRFEMSAPKQHLKNGPPNNWSIIGGGVPQGTSRYLKGS